jgi:hypothetical protein
MFVHANLIRLVALLAMFALSGCVTRSYRLAPKTVPPAVALNLSNGMTLPVPEATAAPTSVAPEVVLHSVIVYRGPGSWKREALWDEYVVSIRNPRSVPVVIQEARLQDGRGDPILAGDNPWKLEKVSKTWWQANAVRQTGTYLALGAGTAAGVGAAMTAALGGMFGGTVSSGTAAAGSVGAAAVVALPLVAGGTVFMNLHRKYQVQDEFNRRRLVLPASVAPGGVVRGSLFFRVTPAPQRLSLQFKESETSGETSIELTPLAGLHIKQPRQAPPGDSPVPGNPGS